MSEPDVAQIRNYVIGQFCSIEEQIDLWLYFYYRNTDSKRFVEDMFLTWLNWFGLKIELLSRIIDYEAEGLKSFLSDKKVINKFIQDLRNASSIRNYFAHNSLWTITSDGHFRQYKKLDFGTNILEEKEKFETLIDNIWPVIGWIVNHLINKDKGKEDE